MFVSVTTIALSCCLHLLFICGLMERGEEGEGRKGRDRVYVWVRDERERERERECFRERECSV